METSAVNLNSFVAGFLCTIALSEPVLAADDINQYGLGEEIQVNLSESVQSGNHSYKPYLEMYDFSGSAKNKAVESAFQLDVGYLDKKADLTSPHHSYHTEFDNRFNNTSREFKTRMGYHFDYLTPEAAVKYSPDSYGMGEYFNYELGVSVPVQERFALETRYGWNLFERTPEKGGIQDYQDWSIGVSTTYKGVKLKVDYIDIHANEDSEECGHAFPCEGKTVFSIIKNF